MPKVELGTFGVVAGEELKTENKTSLRGVLFASLACCAWDIEWPLTTTPGE
jgi:hypothetical protein